MTAAIFGLLGVFVGAASTGVVEYFLRRRTEKREALKAKRLVGDELDTLRIQFNVIAEKRILPIRGLGEKESGFLPTVEWGRWKEALAASLSGDEWIAITSFYSATTAARALYVDYGHQAALDDGQVVSAGGMRDLAMELSIGFGYVSLPIAGETT